MARLFDQIVLSCEHGGNVVPTDYIALFRGKRRLLDPHRGWDPGTLELGRYLYRQLGLPLIANTTTRLLIDVNRSATNPRAFSEITRPLDKSEKRRIIERYYRPHVERLAGEIEAHVARGARVLHLGLHSFTPQLNGETRNADIALLYDPQRKQEVAVAKWLRDCIMSQMPDLRFRMNYPYRGTADGLTTIFRRRFMAKVYLGIELEVNQSLVKEDALWILIKRNLANVCDENREL